MAMRNAEGETPRQEKMEGYETPAKEKSEMKMMKPKMSKPSSSRGMFDVKPGESLPHEHKFKK